MRIALSVTKILFLVVVVTLPSTVRASSGRAPGVEVVPRALVERLLAGQPGFVGEPPVLLVGEVPEEIASEVVLPEEARVEGSLSWPDRSTILLAVPGGAEGAEALFSGFWVEEGWEPREEQAVSHGFVEAEDAARSTELCRDDGSSLSWTLVRRSEKSTEALLRYSSGRHSRCLRPRAFHPMTAPSEVPYPRLAAPSGSKSKGSGRSGGSDEEQRSQALETELSAAEVLEHYGAQLSEQGWVGDPPVIYGPLAYQSWRKHDDSGEYWHGLLLVTEKASGERDRSVLYRVSRLAEE